MSGVLQRFASKGRARPGAADEGAALVAARPALAALAQWAQTRRELAVLHVTNSLDSLGGVEVWTRGLVAALQPRVASAVFWPDTLPPGIPLDVSAAPGEPLRVRVAETLTPEAPRIRVYTAALRAPVLEKLFAEVVRAARPDIVHIQHVARSGSLRLPVVAREAGARVVISLHDFFFLCAEPHLAGPDARACGRLRLADDATCRGCLRAKLRHDRGRRFDHAAFVAARARLAGEALAAADAIVAPSDFVREHFRAALGESAERIAVLPLAAPRSDGRARWSPGAPLRVAFLGRLDKAKGRREFFELVRRLRGRGIHFVVIGDPAGLAWWRRPRGIEWRALNIRAGLAAALADIDVVLLLSVVHETYSLALDAAFAAGAPVVAFRAGALAQRVADGETGLLVDLGDVAGLERAVLRLAEDRDLLGRLRETVARRPPRSVSDAAAAYEALYRRLAGRPAPGAAPEGL